MPAESTAAGITVPPPIVVVGAEQEWAARSLESVLTPRGFAVVRAYSGRQTLDLAEVALPDVLMIDSRLSDMDGVDVCRALRAERRIGAHVPVVITTSGPAPREFVRAAYAAGAWSVWEQPLDGELLVLRLRTWVEAKRATDAAERNQFLEDATGLYTSGGLAHRACEVLADAARRQTPVACIAIGPALFGVHTADGAEITSSPRTLVELGAAIAAISRGSDVVGRLGASAFAIVAPVTGAEGAIELVERLRDRLVTVPLALNADGASRLTVQAGVATACDEVVHLRDGNALLQQASTALRFAQSSLTESIRVFHEVPATFA